MALHRPNFSINDASFHLFFSPTRIDNPRPPGDAAGYIFTIFSYQEIIRPYVEYVKLQKYFISETYTEQTPEMDQSS